MTRDIKATAPSHPQASIHPMGLTEKVEKNAGRQILGLENRNPSAGNLPPPCHLRLYFYFVLFSLFYLICFILVERNFHCCFPTIHDVPPEPGEKCSHLCALPRSHPSPPSPSDAPAKSAECLLTASLPGVKHESNISQILPAGWPTTSKSLLLTADLIWERWGTGLEF